MKTLLTLTLAMGVAALLACGKAEDSKPAETPKASSDAAADCCVETAKLQKEVPSCCAERLKGGKVTSECCKATEANPDKPSACCKKTQEIMAKMSDCCKKVLAGGKAEGCCASMAK